MFFDNPFITYHLLPSKLGNIDICLMPNISYLNVLFIVIDAIVNICQKQVFIHVPPYCLCKPQSSLFATSINKDGDHCYGKKVISLKLFKFFINCLQNNCGGNSCMFHCPWCGVHAWGPSLNPSRNKLSISLTLTNWRRVKSGQHTIYQCTKFIGWEGSHSERQRDRSLHWCTNTYCPINDWLVLK